MRKWREKVVKDLGPWNGRVSLTLRDPSEADILHRCIVIYAAAPKCDAGLLRKRPAPFRHDITKPLSALPCRPSLRRCGLLLLSMLL